jgi:hypothetical protein
MRYVLSAVIALAVVIPPTPAHALGVIHAIHALCEKCHAKHDSCFEKLRHHHAMKPKHKHKHKHGHHCEQCGGGCETCY